jgi:hypothetical protein
MRYASCRCGPESRALEGNELDMPADRVEAHSAQTAIERIAQCLRAAGVTATVFVDRYDGGEVYVVSDVPRGRRPTVQRVMRDLAVRWR